MPKFYMCTFSKDWGDEVNIEGLRFFDEADYFAFAYTVKENADLDLDVYFRNMHWETIVSEFALAYTFTEISESTYTELKAKFPSGFGTFIDLVEQVADSADDYDGEDDELDVEALYGDRTEHDFA